MKLLARIYDKDITGAEGVSNARPRLTARALLFDSEGKMAVMQYPKYNFCATPGGGTEPGESREEALRRELLEETGCKCKILSELGAAYENRGRLDFTQYNYFYIALVDGEKERRSPTDDEIRNGETLEWHTFEEVRAMNDRPKHTVEQRLFIQRKHTAAYDEYARLLAEGRDKERPYLPAKLPKKTLYITDLDGTFLTADARISDFSRDTVNRLVAEGMNFTVATARTHASAKVILKDLSMTAPVILMNGVCVYDFPKNKYLKVEYFEERAKRELVATVERLGLAGFLFAIEDETLWCFYASTGTPNAEQFIEDRRRQYGKVFTKVDRLSDRADCKAIYYSISDKYEKLVEADREFRRIAGLRVEFYRDVYHDDFWYLEISSDAASKSKALAFIREKCGFDRAVCFGDNLNDLPMFAACEEKYAVRNAREEVRAAADNIIESNTEDGVARFLAENTAK